MMQPAPRFSIIVPVYNGQDHIRQCLESLTAQTCTDFQIICVDDCGTDSSVAIIESYAQADGRIEIVRQPENRGCARARRRGALESKGSYLLFADQDDVVEPDMLESIDKELTAYPAQVVHFDAYVSNDGGVPKAEFEGLIQWLRPLENDLAGRQVLDACFLRNQFDYSIWNKAYEGSMARRAFAATEDVPVPLGEDNYELFALLFFARSYHGMPGKRFYHYHFGRGFTGHNQKSAAAFQRTIGLATADRLIRRFLERQNVFDEYHETYCAARTHMVEYLLDRWRIEISHEDKESVLRDILAQWDFSVILPVMKKRHPRMLPMLMRARLLKGARNHA